MDTKLPRKRLVVCCDGTWQGLSGTYPTNVVKMAQAVKPIAQDGVPQVAFYSEGIGVRGRFLDRIGGGAFGWGIDGNIQAAYRFLCLNYDAEDEHHAADEIYLFGFSRGAYTVRSLAGLIRSAGGLLPRKDIRKTSQVYNIYRSQGRYPGERLSQSEYNKREVARKTSEMKAVSKDFEDARITLIGCWDTVGSLGVPNRFGLLSQLFNQKYKFHDYRLSRIIDHALHAVALDEPREAFSVAPMQQDPDNIVRGQTLCQTWFPGTHGCVGGGTESLRGLSDGALDWMIDQITNKNKLGLGLDLDPTVVEYDVTPGEEAYGIYPDYKTPFNEKISIFYTFLGKKPRLIEDKEHTIDFDRNLHKSVIRRWCDSTINPPYRPKNIPTWIVNKLNDVQIAASNTAR